MTSQVLVCPVAYNENVKLKSAIERFLKSHGFGRYDYLIVDDGSDDGTSQMIAMYQDRGVRTIRHDQRRGVGAAIRTAILHAIEKQYQLIVIMAGNDKDDPQEIPLLVEPIEKGDCDLVQGSRYLNGRRIGGDMPLYRKIATRLHPWLLTIFVGKKVTDSTNGFRALRLSLFADSRINIKQEWLNAYELEPYILFKSIQLGYRYQEVPVTKIYPSKKLGYTKMKPIVGWWSILRPLFYLRLGIKR